MKILLLLLASLSAFGQTLDLYGGRNDIACSGTNAHFFTQKIGKKWWLCTPLGHGFFFQGVSNLAWNNNTTTGGYNYQSILQSKFAADPNGWQYGWADNTLARIKAWGFNAVGDSSNDYVFAWGANGGARLPATKLPAIPANTMTLYSFENRDSLLAAGVVEKNLMDAIVGSAYTGFVGRGLPDTFDTGYASYVQARWNLTLADSYYSQWLTSPYALGVVVDESDDIFGLNGPGLQPPHPPDGAYHPHAGWISISVPPRRYASAATIAGANLNLTYNDPTLFAKAELIKELDKTTYPATGKYLTIGALNTAWSSTYTTFGSSGTQYTAESIGTGNGSTKIFSGTLAHGNIDHFSVGLKVAGVVRGGDMGNGSVNPQTSFASSTVFGYNYGEFLVYFNTPPANGATLSLTYNYTACGSGTATTTWGTGDGVTQFYNSDNQPAITWACGLSNAVGMTPGTLSIKVNGVTQGTDVATPAITGSGVSSSFVNYTTGAYSFTFLTAPANAAAITVDYHTNGWCNGGTGILDECGAHTAWLGGTDGMLNPALASAGAVTDLNTFLYNFSYSYFNTHRTAFKSVSPNQLMFCPELNNHGGLTRSQTLQAAGLLCDVVQAGANTQALVDATELYAGDVPLFQGFIGNNANPDSALHAFTYGGTLPTQAARGSYYTSAVGGTLNATVAATGNIPNIGYTLWDWADAWCDGGSCTKVNWGLVTSRDNVYDGREAVSALNIACQSPQAAYHTCGGEDFNYGNSLSSVIAANALWISLPPPSSAPCLTFSNGWCNTGLTAIQDNLLGPLIPVGSSPWVYGDLMEKAVIDTMAPAALLEAPVLGAALAGTVSWTSGANTITTTTSQVAAISAGVYIALAWSSVDGAGTGRAICNVQTVTSTTITCQSNIFAPTSSGITAYRMSAAAGPSGFTFLGWDPQNGSNVITTWNYYDTALALYRYHYRLSGDTTYLAYARAYADIQWQWTIDHGYGYQAPRAEAMISQYFRALDGHSERLPYLYNITQQSITSFGSSAQFCPYCDLREVGYALWSTALGAKTDTDITRHANYCSALTTYVPYMNSAQQSDGSWGEREYALNASFVDAPLSYTAIPPFVFQGAPWRQSIDIKMMQAAYESLVDTSTQGCNRPTLAATTLTTITNAITWQRNYGRDSVGRGTSYEVNSQSWDQATVVNPVGTVSIALGSNVLTGVGTTFITSGMNSSRPFVGIQGPNDPRTVYKVASCSSNTSCLLTVNFGVFGENQNVVAQQYSIAPPAFTNCNSSATYCGQDPNDRNLNRTICGGMGWLYAHTLNATYQGWLNECLSATLGGPTAGPTSADVVLGTTLPCSGPACDGYITDTGVAMRNCSASGGVAPCQNFTQIGNLGKNFSEAFGAPGIDNGLAWRLLGAGPVAPTITTSSPITSGTINVAYSFQFAANGTTPITWSGTGLPSWASLSSGGLLTGTPSATGTTVMAISASNAGGSAGPTSFSLTIAGIAPTITSTSPLPGGTNGTPYSFQFTASGSTPITWGATGLPGWASLSSAGLLTGTPDANGTTVIAVTATNATGNSGPQNFSITVIAGSVAPTITSTSPLPNAPLGVAYSFQFSANGTDPITWGGTGLPSWASLSAGGALTGTPDAVAVSTLHITATNGTGSDGPDTFSLTVPGVAPTITTSTPLPGGTFGVAYSLQFAATGTTPITWSSSGLPGWASLSSGGLLTGTPNASGTSSFTVTATNATGSDGPDSFTLAIAPPATVAPTISSSSPLPAGLIGSPYSFQFTATGTTPITWSGTGFPTWASFSSTGLLTGTPNFAATSPLSITATNTAGSAGPTAFSLVVTGAAPIPTCSPQTHVTPPNVTDSRLQTNMALALVACTNSLTQTGTCTVVDVRRVNNAILGAACLIGP